MNPSLSPTPKIVRHGQGERLDLPSQLRYQLLTADDTAGAVALAYVELRSGEDAFLQSENQLFLIERGEFEFLVGGEKVRASAGDFVFAPTSYRCLSATGALYVVEIGDAPSDSAPLVVHASGGEELFAFGDRARVLLPASHVGGHFGVSISNTHSLQGPPLHVHSREDELFLIRAGRYEFRVEGERVELGVGDVLFAPKNIPHTFKVISDEPGAFFLIALPGGFDAFFREAAGMFERGDVSPESIGALGARHGISFPQS